FDLRACSFGSCAKEARQAAWPAQGDRGSREGAATPEQRSQCPRHRTTTPAFQIARPRVVERVGTLYQCPGVAPPALRSTAALLPFAFKVHQREHGSQHERVCGGERSKKSNEGPITDPPTASPTNVERVPTLRLIMFR